MSSNYIRLLNCNKAEMEMFIRSIISKEASSYVDWHSWMSSENPEVTYIGRAASYKDEEGNSHSCRLLSEEEENGEIMRDIFVVLPKGKVERMKLPKKRVIIKGEEDLQVEISDEEIDDILAAMNEAVAQEEAEEEEAAQNIADAIANEIASSEELAEEEEEDDDEDDEASLDRRLQALKKKRFSDYDPDNPEDAELPTIAFIAMTDEEE